MPPRTESTAVLRLDQDLEADLPEPPSLSVSSPRAWHDPLFLAWLSSRETEALDNGYPSLPLLQATAESTALLRLDQMKEADLPEPPMDPSFSPTDVVPVWDSEALDHENRPCPVEHDTIEDSRTPLELTAAPRRAPRWRNLACRTCMAPGQAHLKGFRGPSCGKRVQGVVVNASTYGATSQQLLSDVPCTMEECKELQAQFKQGHAELESHHLAINLSALNQTNCPEGTIIQMEVRGYANSVPSSPSSRDR